MKNVISFIVLTLLFAVAAGCSSNTDVYDPRKVIGAGEKPIKDLIDYYIEFLNRGKN